MCGFASSAHDGAVGRFRGVLLFGEQVSLFVSEEESPATFPDCRPL